MSILETLIGAGGALIGGLTGGSSKSGTTTSTAPWSAQQPYLKTGFQSAAGLYNQYMGQPYYSGDLYANMTPEQIAAAKGAAGWAGGAGLDAYRGMMGNAGQFMNQSGNYIDLANRLGGYNPGDPTQSNISNAGQYANNPYLNGAIDAASRDVTRNLTEDVLPGINRQASGAGNTNSTRTGIAEGIALRGAQDRIGDIASTIRADAYNNGLNMSENARQANQSNMLNAWANGLTGLNNAIGRGMDMTNQGGQGVVNMYDLMGRAGDKFQQDNQGQINADYTRWQGQYNQPWDLLSKYMGAVGGSNWGSTTTSTTPGSWQGALTGALGGATAGLGLYKDFSSLMNTQPAQQPYVMGSSYSGYTAPRI